MLFSDSGTDLWCQRSPLALCTPAAAREPRPQTVRCNAWCSHTHSPPAQGLPPPYHPDPAPAPPARGAPGTPAHTHTHTGELGGGVHVVLQEQEAGSRSHQLSAIFEHLLPGVILAVELLQEALALLWNTSTTEKRDHTQI